MNSPLSASFLAFDLDGTLVDSAPTIMAAWRVWADAYGISQPSLEQALGGRASDTVRQLLPEPAWTEGLAKYLELESSFVGLTKATPGANEFLTRIRSGDWGIVTSSEKSNARERLEYLGLPSPRYLVASDDTVLGKPHPDPYLELLAITNRSACHLAAFEDSSTGVLSASRAGLRVIKVAINTTSPSPPTALTVVDFLPNHIHLECQPHNYLIGAV